VSLYLSESFLLVSSVLILCRVPYASASPASVEVPAVAAKGIEAFTLSACVANAIISNFYNFAVSQCAVCFLQFLTQELSIGCG